MSYSDAQGIDAETVLGDKTVHALIRSLGSTADFASQYCQDLIELNDSLISNVEAFLFEG